MTEKYIRKKKRTGPSHKRVDWEMVEKLAKIMCTVEEIASFVKVSVSTLDRAAHQQFDMNIYERVDKWRDTGRCSLRRKQWLLADKNAAMAIFLGKQHLGQSDSHSLIHSGSLAQEIVHFGDLPAKKWEQESEQYDYDEEEQNG